RKVGARDDVERPDREREEIRRQRWCRSEPYAHEAIGRGISRNLGAVRDGDGIRRDDERQLERRLRRRLVEGRKCAARENRLELGEYVRLARGVDAEDAAQVAIDGGVPRDVDGGASWAHRPLGG